MRQGVGDMTVRQCVGLTYGKMPLLIEAVRATERLMGVLIQAS